MELKIFVHLIYPIEHTINVDVKGSFAVIWKILKITL